MATLTIQDVPDDVVTRLEETAGRHGHSMEHEVREILMEHLPAREELFERIRARWNESSAPTADQVDTWIEAGRS